jgi:hypothetical protein
VSRISVGGILGFIKSKFTPTLKRSERIDRFWKDKETGVTVEVKNYNIVTGDLRGRRVVFFDPSINHEAALPEEEFRKQFYSLGNRFRSL